MREIKFRAWMDDRMMVYRGLFDRNWYTKSKGGLCVNRIHPNDQNTSRVMQYTGQKDKNGKMIYEGDKVKHYDINDYSESREFTETVEFKGGAFYPICTQPGNTFEIVGNKYENPELIK